MERTKRVRETKPTVHIDESRVTISADEVNVGEMHKEPVHWRASSRVSVTPGDVSIDAFGLIGEVHGSLDIVDLPGHPARRQPTRTASAIMS